MVILGIQFSRKREFTIDDKFLVVTFWAVVVSMVGLISTVINGTVDYTYATYTTTHGEPIYVDVNNNYRL